MTDRARPSLLAALAGIRRWLALAGAVILADQVSKAAIVAGLVPGEWHPVTSYFNLVLAFNYGAAFSFLDRPGQWQVYLFLGVGLAASVGIIWWLLREDNSELMRLALSCILGGALGNVVDRIRLGHVVDFLDFHWSFLTPLFPGGHFPAFNLADSAITLGVMIMILEEILKPRSAPDTGGSPS